MSDLPCPCCDSEQIELCSDSNNPMKDMLKCRVCGIRGSRLSWNVRARRADTIDRLIQLFMTPGILYVLIFTVTMIGIKYLK